MSSVLTAPSEAKRIVTPAPLSHNRVLLLISLTVFFALAALCAAPVFSGNRLAVSIRVLLVASGGLSLAGLSGVIFGEMQLRNIGILGYAGVFPVAALLEKQKDLERSLQKSEAEYRQLANTDSLTGQELQYILAHPDVMGRTTFVLDATHTFPRRALDGAWISADDLARTTAANLDGEFGRVVDTATLLREARPQSSPR